VQRHVSEVIAAHLYADSTRGQPQLGIGLARAAVAAGLVAIEVERPARTQRRGYGKSYSIDADPAVLTALRLDADQLPIPRCDGDRAVIVVRSYDEPGVMISSLLDRSRIARRQPPPP